MQRVSQGGRLALGREPHLCWTGGIPSFSSTRSLILSMESVGSMSISISLPVSVLTLIMVPPGGRGVRCGGDRGELDAGTAGVT